MSAMSTPRLKTGDRIADRYEILAWLGGGGFGEVYRGRDVMIAREVAIKVLNFQGEADLETREGLVARFRREAQVAAQIRHPNVITVHDIGATPQGDPFLVMELLSGHDLFRELTLHGPMPPTRALPLFAGCLDALGEAHRQGIVHKDLKPENLFLIHPNTHRETLTIFDFGISHVIQDGRLTMTGQMIGTPSYMAPEYIDHQVVTPAFDVYQMGLILIESLTARAVVYDENPTRCFAMHSTGDLHIPASLARTRLGAVLVKALALDPAERFASAAAFRAELVAIDPASLHFDPSARETLHLREVAAHHGLAPKPSSSPRPALDTVANPTTERATAPSIPRSQLGAKVTSVSGPQLGKGFGPRPAPASSDTPTAAGAVDPAVLQQLQAAAAEPHEPNQTAAFVPHVTGESTPPGPKSGGSVVVSKTLMHQAIADAAATLAGAAPSISPADLTGRPREATAIVHGHEPDPPASPTPPRAPDLPAPAPSPPPDAFYETEELRSVVEREKAVTGRWGFLLVTGLLGLVALTTCPVASSAWVASRAMSVEQRAADSARVAEDAAVDALDAVNPSTRARRRSKP